MKAYSEKLGLLALVIGGLVLIYRLGFGVWESGDPTATATLGVVKARRLLGSEAKITAEEQASRQRLQQINAGFIQAAAIKKPELKLLKVTETLAELSGLSVEVKNTVMLSRTECGINLTGVALPEAVFRFLQQLPQAPLTLKVKRLQLHIVPEKRALDYQITLSTLVVD